jgi:hypothetical protein
MKCHVSKEKISVGLRVASRTGGINVLLGIAVGASSAGTTAIIDSIEFRLHRQFPSGKNEHAAQHLVV